MDLLKDHNKKIFKLEYLLLVVAVHVSAVWVLVANFNLLIFCISTAVAFVMAYSMGIFHHMQFTHDSFQSKPWVSWLGGLLGTLTWRGPMAPPVKYAAMHMVHHAYADTENDPHSPTQGLVHAFMAWFWRMPYGLDKPEQYLIYAPQHIKSDKVLMWMDCNCHKLQGLWALGVFLLGAALGYGDSWWLGGLVYVAYFVGWKTVVVLWLANAVDVINHTKGYRNFETKDDSTNSFLMAAVHLGGAISWHNNHHARPEFFSVRQRWWELDAHYWVLKFLSLAGLVWDIRVKDDYLVETKGISLKS